MNNKLYAVCIGDGHAAYAPPGYPWSNGACPIYAPNNKAAKAKFKIWDALCDYIGELGSMSGHDACGGCECTSAMKRSKGIFRKVYQFHVFGGGQLPDDKSKSFQDQKDLAILTIERIIRNLNTYKGKQSSELIKVAYKHLHILKEITDESSEE